jgi:hypothetical protein
VEEVADEDSSGAGTGKRGKKERKKGECRVGCYLWSNVGRRWRVGRWNSNKSTRNCRVDNCSWIRWCSIDWSPKIHVFPVVRVVTNRNFMWVMQGLRRHCRDGS